MTFKYQTKLALAGLMIGGAAFMAPAVFAGDKTKEVTKEVEVIVKDQMKSIIKIEKDEDGTSVKKHYEIDTENGETKAYEIDEAGNRTEIPVEDIERFGDGEMNFDLGQGNVKVFKFGDGQEWHDKDGIHMKKHVIIDGETVDVMKDADGKTVKKRVMILRDDDGHAVGSGDHRVEKFVFKSDGEAGADIEVDVALRMVERALAGLDGKEDKDSRKARKQLEKAAKALEAAQASLGADG